MAATLLLADDSVTIQRVIELTFANEDVRVVSVGDGAAALERLEAERPDIVLADVSMPRLDGYDLALHIKQSASLRNIPVLLLTGAFEPIDESRARASGCDGILVKPFEPQLLVGRVKELLAGQRGPGLWPAGLSRVEAPTPLAPVVPVPMASPVPAFAPASDAGPDGIERDAEDPLGMFGTWDIPAPASRLAPRDDEAEDTSPASYDQAGAAAGSEQPWPSASDDATALAAPALPVPPVPVAAHPPVMAPVPVVPPSAARAPARTSMGGAFAALLAAEQAPPVPSQPADRPAISEAVIEEIVRRVLSRLAEDTIHRLVAEVAERVISQEIDRIKTNPH